MQYVWDTKWQTFLKSEWPRWPADRTNDLCHIVDPVIHYERSLRTVLACHRDLLVEFDPLNKVFSAFMEATPRRAATAEEAIIIRRQGDVTALIHLEVETFYLFAKILLDRIAIAIEDWFGKARGIPISSHNNLSKNLIAYAEAMRLHIESDLSTQVLGMKRRISHFRDYQIAHERGLRTLRGTKYGRGMEPRISMSPAHPLVVVEGETYAELENLESLMQAIDAYIDRVTSTMAANREKATRDKPMALAVRGP